MLEKINFDEPSMTKEEYKQPYDELMKRLVVLQQQARTEEIGLVVLFEGWNGAGKGSRISDLMYNLDARSTSVFVGIDIDRDSAKKFPGRDWGVTDYFPLMQDYWKALGERGTITFYDKGWYSKAIQQMMSYSPGKLLVPGKDDRHYLDSIKDFEQQLADNGYKVVKFFVHMSKKGQRKRLERLHDDPVTRWRVPEKKLLSVTDYKQEYELFDRLLEGSDFDFAPWILINGEDKRRANLTITRTLVNAIESALAEKRVRVKAQATQSEPTQSEASCDVPASPALTTSFDEPLDPSLVIEGVSPEVARENAAKARVQHSYAPKASQFPIVENYPQVDTIETDLTIDEEDYRKQLKDLQGRLFRLENIMYQRRVPLMIMYEGWDAAGKGGNIKRVAQALDARAYSIFPSPAPTKPELMHPHLWRYWTRLPKAGHVGMYDRSWYGRVLVERVEEITEPAAWARGYDEINAFEYDLVDWGAILLKFWVNVSPHEQLQRFKDREQDPTKQWKITPDDWRNRDKYPQYKSAIDDMFRLTSTTYAPWIILESDDKRYARIKALKIIVDALEDRLEE